MNRRLATTLCVLACSFGAQAHSPPRPACLGEFRSLEHQVGWSPLILIGSIEEVKPDPDTRKADPVPEDKAPPTIARVKVLKLLKGLYDHPEIRIGSGPIGSCAPWPVHYSFQVGEKQIFILPEFPQDGPVRLAHGGSKLDCEKISMVESRLAWARTYRDAYLEEIRRVLPKVHGDAVDLAKEMRSGSSQWPKEEGWAKPSPEFTKVKNALLERLAALDPEAIRCAAAVDWLDPGASWWRVPVWEEAVKEIIHRRGDEVEQTEKARLVRDLARAGVKEVFAAPYLERFGIPHNWLRLDFPPRTLNFEKRTPPDQRTTEFILRCHAYDRGALFGAYGMEFDALADLDASRVDVLLRSLFGSDDDCVTRVARQAIERIPGTHFVDLVLRRMDDDPWAWVALRHPKDADQTNARLNAFLDLAEKTESPYGLAAIWRKLGKTECFEKACVDRAIVGLRAKEAGAEDVLIKAFHEYLQAAMAERRPPEKLSAEGYRKWFASNPAPEK